MRDDLKCKAAYSYYYRVAFGIRKHRVQIQDPEERNGEKFLGKWKISIPLGPYILLLDPELL